MGKLSSMEFASRFVLGMSDDDYRTHDPCPEPSLSQSKAKDLLSRSPRWVKCAPQTRPTAAMDFGSAVDAIVSGDHDRVGLVEASDWRTKAAQAAREAAAGSGKICLLRRDYQRAQAVAAQIAASVDGIDHATRQLTAYWHDGSVWHRGRMDFVSPDMTQIWDLKVSGVSHKFDARHVIQMGYHIQAAAYIEAIETIQPELTGRVEYRWIVADDDAPYDVSIHWPTASMLDLGRHEWRKASAIWRQCLDTDTWLGRQSGAIDAPPWALAGMLDDQLNNGGDLPF